LESFRKNIKRKKEKIPVDGRIKEGRNRRERGEKRKLLGGEKGFLHWDGGLRIEDKVPSERGAVYHILLEKAT